MQLNRDDLKAILSEINNVAQASIVNSIENTPFEVIPITLDLSTERTRSQAFELSFPYRAIYVSSATDASTVVKYIPDTNDSYQGDLSLSLKDVLEFQQPKAKGYLYWEAQAGKSVTIVLFVKASFKSGSFVTQSVGGNSATRFTNRSPVTVTNALTSILAQNLSRVRVTLQNAGGDSIFIGGATVTTANGYNLASGEKMVIENNSGAIYGITTGANVEIRILEDEV